MNAITFAQIKERGKEARRELILASALKLFSEHDFAGVTVRDIAREAGVSPGTIYRYYENLDALFLDAFFVGARELARLIEEELQKDSGCSITRLCELYIIYLNDELSFYRMMGHFMLGGKLSPGATEELNPVMRSLIDIVEKVLIKAGYPDNQKETRFFAHALFSSLNGLMISYARYPGRSLEDIKRHTVRLSAVISALFEAKICETKNNL